MSGTSLAISPMGLRILLDYSTTNKIIKERAVCAIAEEILELHANTLYSIFFASNLGMLSSITTSIIDMDHVKFVASLMHNNPSAFLYL